MTPAPLVTMFYNETVYTFERSSQHSNFTFGGPLAEKFSGLKLGRRPLHMVARIPLGDIPQIRPRSKYFNLPLLYGFNYSGCEMKYHVKITGWIEILELWPSDSDDDFPYDNYPILLPYAPLKLAAPRRCTYAEFAEEIPNMAEAQPAELIVMVPPPATLGVSLWGPDGDNEGVTVVFECSITDRSVRAYNRCIT